MKVEQKVTKLVEEKLKEIERPDLFVVDVKFHTNGRLVVLIDGDNGIGIAECVQISRYVGFKLEEENTIDTAYNLEVSSPGVDFPLNLPRLYAKNVGRRLSIKLADGTKVEAKLTGMAEDAIIIEEQVKEKGKKTEVVEKVIPLNNITETKVVISFK